MNMSIKEFLQQGPKSKKGDPKTIAIGVLIGAALAALVEYLR